MKYGYQLIQEERKRHLFGNHPPEKDDLFTDESLVLAAVAYAIHGVRNQESPASAYNGYQIYPQKNELWENEPWKPCASEKKMTSLKRIRHLQIAGAFIAAEIDRLRRKVIRLNKFAQQSEENDEAQQV